MGILGARALVLCAEAAVGRRAGQQETSAIEANRRRGRPFGLLHRLFGARLERQRQLQLLQRRVPISLPVKSRSTHEGPNISRLFYGFLVGPSQIGTAAYIQPLSGVVKAVSE